MIAQAHGRPTTGVEPLERPGEDNLRSGESRAHGPEDPPVASVVDAAVAPGVAAKDPPHGEDRSRERSRLRRSRRARSANRSGGTCSAARAAGSRASGRRAPAARRSASRGCPLREREDLGRRARSATGSRGSRPPRTDRVVRSARSRARSARTRETSSNAARRRRFRRLRSTAPPSCRETARPRRGLTQRVLLARERVENEKTGRDRLALAVDGVEVAGAREAVASRHSGRSRGEALAPLGAAALEDRAARASRHSRPESVPTLPPAHVRLVRSLHERKSVGGPRGRPVAQYRGALQGSGADDFASERNPQPRRRMGGRREATFPHLWISVWRGVKALQIRPYGARQFPQAEPLKDSETRCYSRRSPGHGGGAERGRAADVRAKCGRTLGRNLRPFARRSERRDLHDLVRRGGDGPARRGGVHRPRPERLHA